MYRLTLIIPPPDDSPFSVVASILGCFVMVFWGLRPGGLEVLISIPQSSRRPLIVKDWDVEDGFRVEAIKPVHVWVQLPKLQLKYWTAKTLSRIITPMGKPIEMDEITSMKINEKVQTTVCFENEYGILQEQQGQYEWLPVKCGNCKGYGHETSTCRKPVEKTWKEKTILRKPVPEEMTVKKMEDDGDHRANTNGKGHVAANNGEDEQVEVMKANGGSKDAALKNNSYIRDPLSNIVGPMTRARRKRMDESLNSLITTTWTKEEIKLEDYKPKTINLLHVTPNGLGLFGEKEFRSSIQGETTGHTSYGGRMDP
ncbi:OLC1v1008637C1 [Oldenlandia corymbosa var. corymbosa]|uniref:OLC1v1008637C1 n=1 Tax=Oldenlandia corymbosa var. corymbosa TaxID=529605 RepID=A0AAV1DPX1_OLDCO|nr:OLC1v1008637C1 [Oldenlandia corymbosa var. corymbosa]